MFAFIPTRFGLALMMFMACFLNYMMRVNMSLNIIAMVPEDPTTTSVQGECAAISANNSLSTRTEHLGREVTFDWSTQEQAYVLAGYFWGYAVTALIGGIVSERWGPRKVISITMLINALLSALSPQAAMLDYRVLVALRLVTGLASGFLFPALHVLVAHWAPPTEKGKFVSALLGGAIGTVVTWSITGPVINNFGWEFAFYGPGIIGFVFTILWWFTVYDSPLDHPRISEKEKQYIIHEIGNKVDHKLENKTIPPLKNILTSFPFLAMVLLHFGSNWGLYFFMTAAPKYVSSALGFNLTSTGLLASLPYLARMLFSLIFGAIGDRIVKRKMMSITTMRKFFCFFSHILPGLLLIYVGYTGCSPILSIALITFSMGSNGAAALTNLVNHQDLAPNFAGTLYGIANGIGNMAGFITPLVTAHFTKNGNGFAEWRSVFLTGASLYIATAIYFIFFGTAETQEWNYVRPIGNNKRTERKDTIATIEIATDKY